MSTLKLKGSTSGYVELTAPATAGDNTITLPTTAGTVAVKDASNNVEVGTGVTIGSPSSNTFTVSTNGSERVRVDSSGRLGLNSSLSGASAYNRLVVNSPDASCWISLQSANTGSVINSDGIDIGLNGSNQGHFWLRENADLLIATNNAERLRVLSGGGLTFNGDTSAANALDDYEEGTWTPTFGGTTSDPTTSTNTLVGTYTKIGNLVYVTARIDLSASSGGSGLLLVRGLPFTVASDSAFPAATVGYKANWTTNGPDYGRFFSNGTAIELYADNNTSETVLTTSNLSASSTIIISGCYRV